ncbi:MaoC/PaaZ C-terminal domain-containing protein, partial [Shewanella algae]|uniref:MaoC/PaaZ C-terminal domain-containing protein n=1 Tax=Shewanella algae TaxID=38313 RepID=UPI00313CF21C
NPIHIDIDFARKAGMPDVFAHGMLSMAWLARLLTDWQPQSKLRRFNARFLGITHLGNQITCTGEVMEIVEENGETLARVEIRS